MNSHPISAVVHGTTSSSSGGDAGLLVMIGLGVIAFVLVGTILRGSSTRTPAPWGPMPGSSSDNGSDFGFLLFVSLVVAILLVIGLRGTT